MSDIEDELMALAGGGGGGASSDEEDNGSADMSRDVSESPEPAPEEARQGVAVKKAPAKSARKRSHDESEEEGEASDVPSSPNSLQSAPMDESDSDSDAPRSRSRGDDEENKYPVEGKFRSLAERNEIMGMREVERETILAERAQEIERQRQNKLLRQLVTNQEKEESTLRKRKISSVEPDDDYDRKPSRQKTGIDKLKTARAEKNERQSRRREQNERNRSPVSKRLSAERDFSDDDDWDRPAKRPSPPRDVPVAGLRDIERVRLGRTRFGDYCFSPGFNEATVGCFTRISLGPHPETREPVYRMARIVGFAEGKPYALENRQGRAFVTDQYVKVAHGKAIKEWPFIATSDSSFTESEFARYKAQCDADNVKLPKQPDLVQKIDDINRLINHTWTETELQAKIDRQTALRKKYNGHDRQRLERAIRDAKEAGNFDKAESLQEELDRLETPRLAFKTNLTPKKQAPAFDPQQERLAAVNRENRRKNQEDIRKAQLKERARDRGPRKAPRGNSADMDGLRRSSSRMDLNGASPANGSGLTSRAGTPAAATPKPGTQTQSPLPNLAKLQQNKVEKKGLPTIHKPIMDDDIIASMDFELDVEIE